MREHELVLSANLLASDFIDEDNGARGVTEDQYFAKLLPRIRDIFEQLHYSMRDVFESTKMHTLIVPELAIAHITVVLDDFAHMFWW